MYSTQPIRPIEPITPGGAGATRQADLVRQLAAHIFEVSETELQSPTRRGASAALARQVAMYVCHVTLGFSFSEIGHLFGRDRTTASHACRVIEDRRDDGVFDEIIGRIEAAVIALGLRRPTYLLPFHGEDTGQ